MQPSTTPVCRDVGVTVSFKRGSHKLDTNAKGALNGVSQWMNRKDDRTLELHGFADTTGKADANMRLSEQRADAVKNYLTEVGVDPTRITTAGRGEVPDTKELPADGRTVTFRGCDPPAKVAEATPPPVAPTPPVEAAPEPAAPEPPPPPPVAETPPPIVPNPYENMPANDVGAAPPTWGSAFGFALLVGGGYQDFTNGNAKNLTSAGGSWDARIVAGTKSYVGFEAAYVGTTNDIQSLGVTSTTTRLVSNGAEGLLRLNIPIKMGYSLFEPYGFVGGGWSRYSVVNSSLGVSDFSTVADNVITLPAGGGIAYAYKAFMLDARGTWTGTYHDNLLLTSTGNNNLNRWGVGGHVGFTF